MGNKGFSSLKICLNAKLIFNAKQSVSRALLVMIEKSELVHLSCGLEICGAEG